MSSNGAAARERKSARQQEKRAFATENRGPEWKIGKLTARRGRLTPENAEPSGEWLATEFATKSAELAAKRESPTTETGDEQPAVDDERRKAAAYG